MPVSPVSSSNRLTVTPDTTDNLATPRFGSDEHLSPTPLAQQIPVLTTHASSITAAATNAGTLGKATVLSPDASLTPLQDIITFGDAFDDIRAIEKEIEEFARDIERAADIISPTLLAELQAQLAAILKAKTGLDLEAVISKLTLARNMLKDALRIAEEIHKAPQETKVKVGILASIAALFRCCMSIENVANDDGRAPTAPSRRTSAATHSAADLELAVSGKRA